MNNEVGKKEINVWAQVGGILVYKQAYSLYLPLIRRKGGKKSFFS